jgi:hypothetical protein
VKNKNQDFLHRRILKHPFSILVLLCIGVFLVGSTFQGRAESFDVTATVPAEPLTQPAIITSPQDGQHLSAQQILVSGTCPDKSYVELYWQDQYAGVSHCESLAFSIPIMLTPGANKLQVRVFNITNSEGPTSPPITVYYDVPIPPAPQNPGGGSTPSTPGGTSGTGGTTPSGNPVQSGPHPNGTGVEPLRVVSDYRYQTRFVGEPWQWEFNIAGGVAPYKVTIDWGDQQITTIERTDNLPFQITHTFNSPGTFQPLVTVTDSTGRETILQLLAIVQARQQLTQTLKLSPLDEFKQYLWLIWPVYVIILLLALSFWLGEQEALKRRRSHSK